MIEKLLKNSGFYIDKAEHNILESELKEMINEIEILSEICQNDTDKRLCVDFSSLREDEPKTSFLKSDILMNSKSKTEVGFKVNKVI